MSVVSYVFFAFLFISMIIYYIVPKKMQWIVLLIASLVFYAYSGIKNLLVVLATALIVYGSTLLMQKNVDQQKAMVEGADRKTARTIRNDMKKKRKPILVGTLVVVIGVLSVIKGTTFAIDNTNRILKLFSMQTIPKLKLIVPLGISFYSFMMISYLMDIYNAKVPAQKNFLKYLTYVLYFPHVTQGPIAKYNEVAPQIYAKHRFDYDLVAKGAQLMLWGFFKKLVIADRLAPFTTEVFGNSHNYMGPIFIIAGIVYSIQIYCDFSGCMDIVRGASECFGIKLGENFERPYFSQTLPEFWRRWHATLGAFFREYVFYPVSTSNVFLKLNNFTRAKLGNELGGNVATCLPILCVWVLTGVWHGANWNYIGWGLFHGGLICCSTIFEQPIEKLTVKLNFRRDCLSWSIFRMLRTFFLCVIGRIIFMGNGIRASLRMLYSSVRNYNVLYSNIELTNKQWLVAFAGMLILLAVSIAQEMRKQSNITETIRDWLAKQNLWLRWLVLITGIMVVLCFGVYGSGVGASFIYEQF